LLEQVPVEQLATFTEQLLGPVEVADEQGRGGLIHTVATYLEKNRSLNETAAVLNVHVNTVRNRLERVSALSGRDPQSFLDSVDLYIALWAADTKKRTGYRLIKPLN
jgi:sugar diacid utilization regulator